MELILQILIGFVALICLAGGANLLIKGAGHFLPGTVATPPVLDNLFRFMSGIYFSLGFLLAWVVFHISQAGQLIFCIGVVIFFSGLGRFYSKLKVGKSNSYLNSMMIFEMVLGIIVIVLQFIRQYK